MLWKSCLLSILLACTSGTLRAEFLAGSAITDVTPKQLPVLINGGMTSRSSDKVNTPVSARSLAFSDGKEKIVIVVVDSCMMPRDLLDNAKAIAAEKAGMPKEHILLSSTHTHTAPSCMGALGTDADPAYVIFLTKKLVEAILAPLQTLQPARIGWGEIDAADYTALRRWVIRPDRMKEDPFGNRTVRAHMHPATNWDDVTGPSGPEDPMLSLISVQSLDGKPIGVLANFSMHYFGDKDISADYYGLFSNGLQDKIAEGKPGFVAMMSHGCSGDIWRHDYAKSPDRAANPMQLDTYSAEMVDLAMTAYGAIQYESPQSIAMQETRLPLQYRVPDKQLLEWAQRIMAEVGDRPVKTTPEVYAREQILLHELQKTEVVVQGLRLGDQIAIATTPNETYALTGLKIKAASPTAHTMVIELANGGDGYIPTPEQHLLGGYNTWPARSAGLETTAEPKITEAAIQLLEAVTGKTRADKRAPAGPAATHLLSLKPRAYWRLDEFTGPRALDASPHHLDAIYEPRVLFYLEGPRPEAFSAQGPNRSAHFAGERLQARIPDLGDDYSLSLWFWNGMPNEGRDETGWIFSRGHNHTLGDEGEHLGIGGTSGGAGTLVYLSAAGPLDATISSTVIERWTWNHLGFVKKGNTISIYLNGTLQKTLENGKTLPATLDTLYFGGRSDNHNNFEGRLDEIAVFDRALSAGEMEKLGNP